VTWQAVRRANTRSPSSAQAIHLFSLLTFEAPSFSTFWENPMSLRGDQSRRPKKRCDECNKYFADTSTLRRHKKIHTGLRPHICDICSFAFARIGDLNVHRRFHSGEKPYSCDICGACFAQSSNMRRHRRSHTGDRPYSCEECGKAFADSSTLRRHEIVHSDAKPFKCVICPTAFARPHHLQRHTNVIHLKIGEKEKPTQEQIDRAKEAALKDGSALESARSAAMRRRARANGWKPLDEAVLARRARLAAKRAGLASQASDPAKSANSANSASLRAQPRRAAAAAVDTAMVAALSYNVDSSDDYASSEDGSDVGSDDAAADSGDSGDDTEMGIGSHQDPQAQQERPLGRKRVPPPDKGRGKAPKRARRGSSKVTQTGAAGRLEANTAERSADDTAQSAAQAPAKPRRKVRVVRQRVLDQSSLDSYVKDSLSDLDIRLRSCRRTLANAELLVGDLNASRDGMLAERRSLVAGDSLSGLDARIESCGRTIAGAKSLVDKLAAAQEAMKADRVRLRGLVGGAGESEGSGAADTEESLASSSSDEEEDAKCVARRLRSSEWGRGNDSRSLMDRLLAVYEE
jgi:Zinc finger, C2H2 type